MNNTIANIKNNIQKVIIGKDELLDYILTAILARGHVLLEDVPGTGKTMLSKSLAASLGLDFRRIQFTPDLLPSDVTGINYYNQKAGEFSFREGPIFTNLLLADEINRATARTQSSLLESMEERQVTIDGKTYNLDEPFFVMATQNPIETVGTYPLPEAQLDRFLMKLQMGSPSKDEEIEIMNRFLVEKPMESISSVCSKEQLISLQRDSANTYIHPLLVEYIANISLASRNSPEIITGVSPRGSLALSSAARAYAFIQGRSFVIPDDIKNLSHVVLAHRLVFPRGSMQTEAGYQMIDEILSKIPVPTEDWEN